MKARLERLELIGAHRSFEFTPGLNIVSGPITTGKTTLLRLCRTMFGGAISRFPSEVRENVQELSGVILLGEERYSIVRPFTTSLTAGVNIAGEQMAARLPALQPDDSSSTTFGRWLLEQLGLPRLEVPSAPSRPDSDPTPISINDYFLYCSLTQDEIDSSVFGHRDTFKDIKRRYVFEVLYGIYDVRTAQLQESLRYIQGRLSLLGASSTALRDVLQGTPWADRQALAAALAQARAEVETIGHQQDALAHSASSESKVESLRRNLLGLDAALAELRARRLSEASKLRDLEILVDQLQAQSARLTRAIAADTLISDIEFVVCPRCSSPISSDRGDTATCRLCLQNPARTPLRKDDYAREQERVNAQIAETNELLAARTTQLIELDGRLVLIGERRKEAGLALDHGQARYVSDNATTLTSEAYEQGRKVSDVQRFTDYMQLFERADLLRDQIDDLRRERDVVLAKLDAAKAAANDSESRIVHLEQQLAQILDTFRAPRFGEVRDVRIDRRTYLPIIDGRRCDELSSQGLLVLVNVAHALAHHLTAIHLDIPLPGILFIDGLTSNLGHEDEDLDRVHGVYRYLMQVSRELGDRLQLIVADNDVPSDAADYVQVRFGEHDRLIPEGVFAPTTR